MRDLNRRERNSENATARTSAAENAGFSVAAGTMALGAALSEDARAATPARADLAPNPALPAHETASREARADAPPPAPDEGGRTPDSPSQQAVNADAPLERPEQPPIARPQADAPTLDATAAPGNGGFDSGDATMNPVGPDSAATPAGSSSLPDTPFASRMSDTVTEDMAALFGRLSESSVELSSIVSTAVDDALDGIDRLADQVASAVESPNLPLIDQIGDAPVAPVLTWTAIDGALGGDASVLQSLPTSLLGAHAEEPADGLLAQTVGSPNDSVSVAIDDTLFATETAIPPPPGFLGQSYIDAIDPHDMQPHAMNSPMHGLI
jgi:hypothetical protein